MVFPVENDVESKLGLKESRVVMELSGSRRFA